MEFFFALTEALLSWLFAACTGRGRGGRIRRLHCFDKRNASCCSTHPAAPLIPLLHSSLPLSSQMDYDKISGFFPMEWILSGDFGWGFNKKKKRLAEEATDEK